MSREKDGKGERLYKLSAEAESFVPRSTPLQQAQISMHKDESPAEVGGLPAYMTNCYPFVQVGEMSNPHHKDARLAWMPGTDANLNIRPPSHHAGVRPTRPRHSHSGGGRGALLGMPPGMSVQAPPFSPGMPPYGPPHRGMNPNMYPWRTPTRWGVPGNGNFGTQLYRWDPYSSVVSVPPGPDLNPSPHKAVHDRGDAGGRMVSIGVQKETKGSQRTMGGGGRKRSRSKTIICMDAAVQTDFNEELAKCTLADRPNALYRKANKCNSGWFPYKTQEHSTESEEVDSDSGYSSPLHHRNRTSNGTDPVAGLVHGQSTSNAPESSPQSNKPLCNPHNAQPYFATSKANSSNGPSSVPPSLPGMKPGAMSYSSVVSRCANNNNQWSVPDKPSVDRKSTEQPPSKGENSEPEGEQGTNKKKRGKKRKKRRKSTGDESGALSDAFADSNPALSSASAEKEYLLNFEDEEEFPTIWGPSKPKTDTEYLTFKEVEEYSSWDPPRSAGSQSVYPSYSDVIRHSALPTVLSQDSSVSHSTTGQKSADRSHASTPNSFDSKGKESKGVRRRRKRREQANKAAEDELAEITLEQEVLRELSNKHKADPKAAPKAKTPPPPAEAPKAAAPSGKKSKQPISLSIADMIDALEQAQFKEEKTVKKDPKVDRGEFSNKAGKVANLLDSSAPTKRGKEREVPRVKKPSPLKKVILKEREEKKRLRLLEETVAISPNASTNSSSQLASVAGLPLDSDLSQDGSKASSYGAATPATVDMSPISQTSPVSMSPLSGSPFASGINSPIACGLAGLGIVPKASGDDIEASVLMKIHSRRYREYCKQVLSKDIDSCCTALLQDLIRFQDRLFHKDPIKAKSKRRIVLGLREVTKHLKLKKIRCVIISPNLERIQSKGGLDEALNTILHMCQEQSVPFVFALGRRALGRACAKLVAVSVVGIFNYEGSEGNFKRLMELMGKAREAYDQMVAALHKELQEHRVSTRPTGPQLFPHMGHSRTPSACSAISFTSSILSEPISENYPRSEPETDSRGYEIVHENMQKGTEGAEEENKESEDEEIEGIEEEEAEPAQGEDSTPEDKIIIVESLNDIDDGHEADTEEDLHRRQPETGLPPIDSIHSSAVDLSAEILSQHSSKALEFVKADSVVSKTASTDEALNILTTASSSSGQKAQIDKDRIELWVADTQKQIEHLSVDDDKTQ